MRLLLYNIRYATGTGPGFHFPLPGIGYLRNTSRNLSRITDFIRAMSPDIVGLIEVDMGSLRSSTVNQAEAIAQAIGHAPRYQSKYGATSINRLLPIVSKQGNAFLTSQSNAVQRFHYFELGIKRLIMELELEDVCLFLVHLSLHYRHRHQQMHHLFSLVRSAHKPVIVAGDFNTLWGNYEIELFAAAAGLKNANMRNSPSWPSRRPSRQLDFILYGPGINVTHFELPRVTLSDHLPLVCDFEVNREAMP
ncbi:MAG TPA: endonuclease/exonuclease/phosphatase family protein [Gammaproteobacteria bacterium]|nr:endonuclease/exonuclease/phosphatase family protein [Gammaproteobacteria bacterium]